MEKPLASSNPMLHFQIRTPSTGVRPSTTLFHGLVGGIDWVPHIVRKRRLDDLARMVRFLRRPIPEAWRSVRSPSFVFLGDPKPSM